MMGLLSGLNLAYCSYPNDWEKENIGGKKNRAEIIKGFYDISNKLLGQRFHAHFGRFWVIFPVF